MRSHTIRFFIFCLISFWRLYVFHRQHYNNTIDVRGVVQQVLIVRPTELTGFHRRDTYNIIIRMKPETITVAEL